MAQQLTVFTVQAWRLEFNSWNSCKGGRKKLIPQVSADLHVLTTAFTLLHITQTQ